MHARDHPTLHCQCKSRVYTSPDPQWGAQVREGSALEPAGDEVREIRVDVGNGGKVFNLEVQIIRAKRFLPLWGWPSSQSHLKWRHCHLFPPPTSIHSYGVAFEQNRRECQSLRCIKMVILSPWMRKHHCILLSTNLSRSRQRFAILQAKHDSKRIMYGPTDLYTAH